jgi:hypothetical protein
MLGRAIRPARYMRRPSTLVPATGMMVTVPATVTMVTTRWRLIT